ncbi:hypothetical protein [Vagococcus acidifermentans]|uniref:hypothetical protein n=1 Tax=Vagococcus acidifermentans TaxID=564710 RepID=UPI000F873641|nr:hypothetical protein [Vagococcus acidifermentans]
MVTNSTDMMDVPWVVITEENWAAIVNDDNFQAVVSEGSQRTHCFFYPVSLTVSGSSPNQRVNVV